MAYTSQCTTQELVAALELIENLDGVGIGVVRRNRSLEFSADLTDALRATVQRNFNGLMFVVRCREESERVLRRLRRRRHTGDRARTNLRRQTGATA